MTFRTYLWWMGLATILAWLGWGWVLWQIDPGEDGVVGLVLFYLTLFVSLVGSGALAGMLYRRVIRHSQELLSREVNISFRRAVLLSLVAVISLALSAANWWRWWNGLLLVGGTFVMEYIILVHQQNRRA